MERSGLKTDLAPLSNFQFAANQIPRLGMDGTVFEIYTRAVLLSKLYILVRSSP